MSRASGTISTEPRGTEPRALRAEPRRSRWGRTLAACAAVMTAGLAVAAISGAVLTWDGAAALVRVLHYAEPFATHGRVVVAVLQLPVLALQRVTEDPGVLRLAYSVPYVLLPPLTLAACWATVGRRSPRLLFWPVLAIALATLPGQLFFISENIIALQLAWPLLLVVLTGIDDVKRAIGAAVLTAVLFLLHPVSAAIFVLVAVIAVVNVWLRRAPAAPMFGLVVAMVGLAAFRLVRLTDYERGEVGSSTLALDFSSAVAGAPLIGLAIGVAIGLVVLLAAHSPAVRATLTPAGRGRLLAVGLLGAAAALLPWAGDPSAWSKALEFRSWALFASLPFFALAIADVWWPALGRPARLAPSTDGLRQGFAVGLAGLFALVIGVASLSWGALLAAHEQELAARRSPCVTQDQLSTTQGTPLEHWATGSLTVLQQSRAPLRLVLETPQDCRAFLGGAAPAVLGRDGRTLRPGWFSFDAARWTPRQSAAPGEASADAGRTGEVPG